MFSQLGINRIREKDILLCMQYYGASPEAFGEILNSLHTKNITNYNKIHTCPALFEKILYYQRQRKNYHKSKKFFLFRFFISFENVVKFSKIRNIFKRVTCLRSFYTFVQNHEPLYSKSILNCIFIVFMAIIYFMKAMINLTDYLDFTYFINCIDFVDLIDYIGLTN